MAETPTRTAETLLAPAKLNLYLHVTGRRNDGYHLLNSLVAFTAAGDRLGVEWAGHLDLSLEGPFAGSLAGEDPRGNLIWRAATTLADRFGIEPHGRLTLTKNLPVASGIGGGSSDAAAALLLLADLWGLPVDTGMLAEIALGLGADVPMCLAARPVLVGGIGEVLTAAPELGPAGILLVNPGIPLPTPAVFRARSGAFSEPATLPGTLAQARDLARALAAQRNDLEPAAISLAPAIGTVLHRLAASPGCLLARMSGSGATCFGLYEDEAAAAYAATSITAAEPTWWCCPTHLASRPSRHSPPL